MIDVEKRLFALQDNEYGNFIASLIPNIEREQFIGVRVPLLRKLVKEIIRDDDYDSYLLQLPYRYYEEKLVAALIINEIKDFKRCLTELEMFLPYVDNWALCDSLKPKVLIVIIKSLLF